MPLLPQSTGGIVSPGIRKSLVNILTLLCCAKDTTAVSGRSKFHSWVARQKSLMKFGVRSD